MVARSFGPGDRTRYGNNIGNSNDPPTYVWPYRILRCLFVRQ